MQARLNFHKLSLREAQFIGIFGKRINVKMVHDFRKRIGLVPETGLAPATVRGPASEAGASANFATRAPSTMKPEGVGPRSERSLCSVSSAIIEGHASFFAMRDCAFCGNQGPKKQPEFTNTCVFTGVCCGFITSCTISKSFSVETKLGTQLSACLPVLQPTWQPRTHRTPSRTQQSPILCILFMHWIGLLFCFTDVFVN